MLLQAGIIGVNSTLEEPHRLCRITGPPFPGGLLKLVGGLEELIFRVRVLWKSVHG